VPGCALLVSPQIERTERGGFRWHLGTDQPSVIRGEDGNWHVVWPEGTLALTSSVPLTVTQEKLPDHTVCLGRKDNGWDFRHTCVVVRTAQSVSHANLTTSVRGAR
jgi:hypothetical protein